MYGDLTGDFAIVNQRRFSFLLLPKSYSPDWAYFVQ
jgi:hypothetical protein